MAPQVILAIVKGQGSDRPLLDTTRRIAERFDSHVDVALLCPDPGLAVPYMSEGMSGEIIERLISDAEALNARHTKKARSDFQAWRDDSGFPLADSRSELADMVAPDQSVPSCSWSEVTGSTDHLTATMGRLADLIVVTHDISEENKEFGFASESALMECGRPLLLAPSSTRDTVGDKIMVAWDGSAEAARAVAAALPLLGSAQSVTIVSVIEKDKDETPVDGLARYLSWHNITANTRIVDANDRPVGAAILDTAKQEASDFLVMGAYGHSRYREWIFGGATRHILNECTLPVLLAH